MVRTRVLEKKVAQKSHVGKSLGKVLDESVVERLLEHSVVKCSQQVFYTSDARKCCRGALEKSVNVVELLEKTR